MSARRDLFRSSALAVACVLCAAPLPGCEPDFEPSNKLSTLRVLAVRADQPYPAPGSTVQLEMLWYDGKSPPDEPRKDIQVLWIGGCFDPLGDLYYGCYPEFAKLFGEGGQPSPDALKYLGTGNTFSLQIPQDIISRRPPREGVEPYGVSFVFFAVCAGQIRPTQATGSAALPFGCYDADGKELGPEDFVPGYLNLYSYDSRTNENPVVTGFSIGEQSFPETEPVPDTRVRGCRPNDCASIPIKALVDKASAELDQGALDPDGKPLTEMLWVNYYASGGELEKSARLVNDATKGWNEELGVMFKPPAPGEKAWLFTVVHDNRGGIGWSKRRLVAE
jgi:hypothetical protein